MPIMSDSDIYHLEITVSINRINPISLMKRNRENLGS